MQGKVIIGGGNRHTLPLEVSSSSSSNFFFCFHGCCLSRSLCKVVSLVPYEWEQGVLRSPRGEDVEAQLGDERGKELRKLVFHILSGGIKQDNIQYFLPGSTIWRP